MTVLNELACVKWIRTWNVLHTKRSCQDTYGSQDVACFNHTLQFNMANNYRKQNKSRKPMNKKSRNAKPKNRKRNPRRRTNKNNFRFNPRQMMPRNTRNYFASKIGTGKNNFTFSFVPQFITTAIAQLNACQDLVVPVPINATTGIIFGGSSSAAYLASLFNFYQYVKVLKVKLVYTLRYNTTTGECKNVPGVWFQDRNGIYMNGTNPLSYNFDQSFFDPKSGGNCLTVDKLKSATSYLKTGSRYVINFKVPTALQRSMKATAFGNYVNNNPDNVYRLIASAYSTDLAPSTTNNNISPIFDNRLTLLNVCVAPLRVPVASGTSNFQPIGTYHINLMSYVKYQFYQPVTDGMSTRSNEYELRAAMFNLQI